MREIFSMVAVAAVVLSLAGCGGQSDAPAATASASASNPLDALISAARANPAPASLAAPPDPVELKRAISSGIADGGLGGIQLPASPNSREKAMGPGWNYFQVSHCAGIRPAGGTFYLVMYMRDGSFIWSPDPGAIAGLAPACTTAPAVGVFVEGFANGISIWSTYTVYHF